MGFRPAFHARERGGGEWLCQPRHSCLLRWRYRSSSLSRRAARICPLPFCSPFILPSHEQVVVRPDNPHFARAAQDEARSDCTKPTWRKRSETPIKESKDQLDQPSAKSAKR